MADKRKNLIFYSAVLLCSAAVIARCFQFFTQTDLSTGHLKSGGNMLSLVIAALVIGACSLAFSLSAGEGATALCSKSSSPARVFMFLSSAALFYDFVRQCINIYNYFTKNSYVKLSYIIPLALFGVLALFAALYFFALGAFLNNRGYDFSRSNFLHYVPLFWAVFGLFTGLGVLDDLRDVQQTFYKTAVLIFAAVFFAVYAASFSRPGLNKRVLSGVGFAYSFVAAVYSLPELFALATGACSFNTVYFAGTYLITGAFAFSVSRDMLYV